MSAPISIQKISREQVEIPKPKNHPFNQTFQTACESFSGQGINIVSGRGFGQVLDDAAAYESYKDAMFGDIQNEDVKLALETVMENDRSVIDGAVGGNIAMERFCCKRFYLQLSEWSGYPCYLGALYRASGHESGRTETNKILYHIRHSVRC